MEEQRPQSVLAACRAAIHDAEGAVERAREVAAKAAEALQEARRVGEGFRLCFICRGAFVEVLQEAR